MQITSIRYHKFLSGLSPWIILGAVLVLLPMVAFMTMSNINRQKRQSIRLMVEKGAALIRSFEAGTRMGMRGGHGRGFQLQRLLMETASQPDIAYLLVVRSDGVVIAHSQLDRVGSHFGRDIDLKAIHAADGLAWRRTIGPDQKRVFEIYGRFAPLALPPGVSRHRHMMRPQTPYDKKPPAMVIFVGMHTDAVDAARAADTRHTVVMALVLLLVGASGVLLLFLANNYRSARTSLFRARAFSDNLVARMPIGLVALDGAGRVTAVNSVAAATLKKAQADMVGQTAGHVLPAELAAVLSGATRRVEKELVCRLASGQTLPLDVSAASLTDEEGKQFGQVILFKDLTELRALRRELEKNRRLASVGRLAAGVAHEIRNPLSSIKGFATYFKDKYRHVARDQEIAGILIQEVERLDRVVGQLMEFSRPIRLQVSPLDLPSFFQDTLQLVAARGQAAGVTFDLIVDEALPAAHWDADKMRQVMLNLLINALDAMQTGGRIVVTAAPHGQERICITVSDDGPGIVAESQPHIFEPYFSTRKGGTGLGLAIVHNIIKAHGGQVGVVSPAADDRGTRIQIRLPIEQEVP